MVHFFSVVEAQDLLIRWYHRDRVLSDRMRTIHLDDGGGDQKYLADGSASCATSDSAELTATVRSVRRLRRSHRRVGRQQDHPAAGVNRDASLFCPPRPVATRPPWASGQEARLVAPSGSTQAARWRALAHNRRGNDCPRSQRLQVSTWRRTAHTYSRADTTPPLCNGSYHVDERHDCRDTRPACVPGTV